MERMKQDIKYVSIGMYKQLEEENKKLNIKVASLEGEIKGLNSVIEKLKEENQTLELWLDNKEKVNKHLREENKNLKSELELVRKNTRANVETLDNMYGELVDLEKENKELQKDLDHRDSFFSIMRDVLANETITNNEIAMIVYCVVHEECGDYDLSKVELKIAKEFWERKYI